MFQAELLEQIKRGHDRLSESGKTLLKTSPTSIDKKTLENYAPFRV